MLKNTAIVAERLEQLFHNLQRQSYLRLEPHLGVINSENLIHSYDDALSLASHALLTSNDTTAYIDQRRCQQRWFLIRGDHIKKSCFKNNLMTYIVRHTSGRIRIDLNKENLA